MMTARTMRVNRWGNSLGICFPDEFVDNARLEEKSLVEMVSDGERLIITKAKEATLREAAEDECPLLGLTAGSSLTVDKFLAMTREDKI